jgi:hypothetical protein
MSKFDAFGTRELIEYIRERTEMQGLDYMGDRELIEIAEGIKKGKKKK